MNKYLVGAMSDIGADREVQEDFVQFKELDEDNLLCIVADGAGSRPSLPQPAAILTLNIVETIDALFQEKKELVVNNPKFFLKHAMIESNRLLGAFKLGSEERYAGMAASVTCCLFLENDRFVIAHSGNTRVYIIRNAKIIQLTKDQTKAETLLEEGKIDIETYHIHPDRLQVTGGLGIATEPNIQLLAGAFKDGDIILMTSDGVHFAIQPTPMMQIVLESQDQITATSELIHAAKEIIKYPDNMSAMVICKNGATE